MFAQTDELGKKLLQYYIKYQGKWKRGFWIYAKPKNPQGSERERDLSSCPAILTWPAIFTATLYYTFSKGFFENL